MNNMEILVNHQARTVTVVSKLEPSTEATSKNKNLFDEFDFNSDQLGRRTPWAEAATRLVHQAAPAGSTSYRIFTVPGKSATFKKTYKFRELFLKD